MIGLKFNAKFLDILWILSDPQKKKNVRNIDFYNIGFVYSKIIEIDEKSPISNNYFEYLNNRKLIKIQYIFDTRYIFDNYMV